MPHRIARIYDPARFQSEGRRGGWFEGWYFKLTGADGAHPIAIIPGVSHAPDANDSHSFVQVIRPGGSVHYHRFPYDAFAFDPDRFEVRVGPNVFSAEGLKVDLPSDGEHALRGQVEFGPWTGWPVSALSPGVMGWYRFVPRMECYHGALSFDHSLRGTLLHGDQTLEFAGGRGYAEKDWGTSFPSSWIWAQSNHFDVPETIGSGPSLFLSVARIPWMGSSFTGHIAGLLLDGEVVRFATYTGSHLIHVATGGGAAQVLLRDRRRELSVEVSGAVTGELKAPVQGAMVGRANEGLDAQVVVELRELRGGRAGVVFSGRGSGAGVEIMNALGELSADV
ncbi:MAG: hypothetical protein CVT67_11045 [Actinobacteria bacterium HGW-Actinobacteria-7]|nr:MAG: hypothetical protein CVT67_11045 [Actinobacteria bacterium HGW-Actinobacteria-7]